MIGFHQIDGDFELIVQLLVFLMWVLRDFFVCEKFLVGVNLIDGNFQCFFFFFGRSE